jgi:hypothetical protein
LEPLLWQRQLSPHQRNKHGVTGEGLDTAPNPSAGIGYNTGVVLLFAFGGRAGFIARSALLMPSATFATIDVSCFQGVMTLRLS